MASQMKIVNDTSDTIHAVKEPGQHKSSRHTPQYKRPDPQKLQQELWNCGQVHDVTNREACPAFGKECRKCIILHQDVAANGKQHRE